MGEKNPFYRTPERRRTSAEIIRDAKKAIRSLSTKRPFTPRDEKRTLFGEGSNRNPDARPASTYRYKLVLINTNSVNNQKFYGVISILLCTKHKNPKQIVYREFREFIWKHIHIL